jgi:hypothetical protein
MTRRTLRLSLLATTLLTPACGSDNPANPQNNLSQVEAIAVFSEIMTAVFSVGFGGDIALAANAPAISADVIAINESAPCDGGGSIDLTGTISSTFGQSQSGSYSYTIVETPDDCVVTTGSGTSYRVNGNPNIQMAGSYNFVGGVPTGVFAMTFTGGLSWLATNGGASGSCAMNLSYSLDWQTSTGSVQGSICGYDVSQQY